MKVYCIFTLLLICVFELPVSAKKGLQNRPKPIPVTAESKAEKAAKKPTPIPFASVEKNGGRKNNEKGQRLVEGDLVKPENGKQEGSDRNAINAGANQQKRWPKTGGIVKVPYTFQKGLNEKTKNGFLAAVADFAGWTCVDFTQRTNQKDYLEIIYADGCWSSLGRTGDRQELSLGEGCDNGGTPEHEMMHALGLDHEQNRPDRDSYVTIVKANIEDEYVFAFEKCQDCSSPPIPYDYSSVMHYEKEAFSKNDKDTIVPKQSGVKTLGQRVGMCELDIKKINWLYQCNGITASKTKPKGGYIPCKVPKDNWINCGDFKDYCADPAEDYVVLTNCPVTCKGIEKKEDQWSNCTEFKNFCADPAEDYINLRSCPVTCYGASKGDPYDKFSGCDARDCPNNPTVQSQCAKTCS